MDITRRQLLGGSATTGIATLAGCSGGCVTELPFIGSSGSSDGVIATEAVESAPRSATVVSLSSLGDTERSLVETAVDDGVVWVCMDNGEDRVRGLSSFSSRVDPESYLQAGENYYALWVRITDQVFAGSASAPQDDVDPCC